MVKTIVDHFKLRELQSVVPSCVVEPSGRHLIRGSNFFFLIQVARGQRKQGLGNGKDKSLFIYPRSTRLFVFFSPLF